MRRSFLGSFEPTPLLEPQESEHFKCAATSNAIKWYEMIYFEIAMLDVVHQSTGRSKCTLRLNFILSRKFNGVFFIRLVVLSSTHVTVSAKSRVQFFNGGAMTKNASDWLNSVDDWHGEAKGVFLNNFLTNPHLSFPIFRRRKKMFHLLLEAFKIFYQWHFSLLMSR